MTSAFDGHIVLVGPMGVGKTPIAEMVAERLSIDHVNLDLKEEDRLQVGWRQEESLRLTYQQGYPAELEYDAEFAVPLIAHLMEQYPSAVLDCGGDDLLGWTDGQRKKIKNGITALQLKHIVAIFPFSDTEKTRSYLTAGRPLNALNELLLSNPTYRQITNKVFCTEGRRLEPVVNAIIDWVLG